MINCDYLKKTFKQECYFSNGVAGIMTPLIIQNKPIYAFFNEEEGRIASITDQSDTLFEAWSLTQKGDAFLKSATNKLNNIGVQVIDGEITVNAKDIGVNHAYNKFLRACSIVIDYTESSLMVDEKSWYIIDDIEKNITRRNGGNLDIERNISIKSSSGITANFPLSINGVLIDAMRPNSNSTGSILRKSTVITKSDYLTPLIIIDDTENRDAANRESDALNILCRTMMFSDLKNQNSSIMLMP